MTKGASSPMLRVGLPLYNRSRLDLSEKSDGKEQKTQKTTSKRPRLTRLVRHALVSHGEDKSNNIILRLV